MLANAPRRLIETHFPIERVSEAGAAEKSIRQEHISTLQLWWARRPLGVCRSAIFAALCPPLEAFEASQKLRNILDGMAPGDFSVREKLLDITARLAFWDAIRDEKLLNGARELLRTERNGPPLVVDTFAGGGSFPLEALRLGLDAFAGELNPVAAVALRAALEFLPNSTEDIGLAFREAAELVGKNLPKVVGRLYGGDQTTANAYFWCLTYLCPACQTTVPLLRDRWLARGKTKIAVKFKADKSNLLFSVVKVKSSHDEASASEGTITKRGAICPKCRHVASTSFLRDLGLKRQLGEKLYAKLSLDSNGQRQYESITHEDEIAALQCSLRKVAGRKIKSVPDLPFDTNGIRHLWAMQYGINSTGALYNKRQGIALLEVVHQIQLAISSVGNKYSPELRQAVALLLALTFNRLVMYGSRHTWWQPNGEFPANMFGRQAISMVWNYVEIPPHSLSAAGWKSARGWIEKLVVHLAKIPRKGVVSLGDAASTPLGSETVDLVTIDPPYFDSITYAYLSDVFYAWMKPILGSHFPSDFEFEATPKKEEAIVDRKHKLALSPKTALHFRRKMQESLKEAHRILKPEGKLLLMYGHKKIEAWEILLGSLFDAGFIPTASWPIHTERKAKFRHGKVAALSTSCLMVCERRVPGKQQLAIGWTKYTELLQDYLDGAISRFEANHVLGTDLATALLAPACALYAQHDVRLEDGTQLSIAGLLNRLPKIIQRLELDGVLKSVSLGQNSQLKAFIQQTQKLNENEIDRTVLQRLKILQKGPTRDLLAIGADFVIDLQNGQSARADAMWEKLPTNSQRALQAFFRALSLVGQESGITRQLADGALGRISLSSRARQA